MAKLIAIWGSPNSGATTVACALASELGDRGYSALLIESDDITPTIATLLPKSINQVGDELNTKSIGKILSEVNVSVKDIWFQCTTVEKQKNIALLGYGYGENKSSYPVTSLNDCYNLYSLIGNELDYIIVDCMASIKSSPLSEAALQMADAIIRVGGCGYKDLSYFTSQMPYMNSFKITPEQHIIVLGNVKPNGAYYDLKEFYGRIDFILKYNRDVEQAMECGDLLNRKLPREYMSVIQSIANLPSIQM